MTERKSKSWIWSAALVLLGVVALLLRKPDAAPLPPRPGPVPPDGAPGQVSVATPVDAPAPSLAVPAGARSIFEAIERERAEVRRRGLEASDHSPLPLLRQLKYKTSLLLAVRAFPDDAVRYFGAKACGRERGSPEEREDALEALGLLLEYGDHGAASAPLLEVAFGGDAAFAERAVGILARRPKAEYIPALTARTEAGSAAAVEGLALLHGEARVQDYLRNRLRTHVPAGTTAEFHRQKLALEVAVERLDWLRSPEATAKLGALLEDIDRSRAHGSEVRWAIEVAVAGRDPGLLGSLRRRVDLIYESNSAWFKAPDSMMSEIDVPDAFDESLWALHRAGGPLREGERRRLEHFGLTGDPLEGLRARGLAARN